MARTGEPWETCQGNSPIHTPNIYPEPATEGGGWGYRKSKDSELGAHLDDPNSDTLKGIGE